MNHFDEDENVRMMRETARTIGLTQLLFQASQTAIDDATKNLMQQALRLLGEEA